jgi:hypothetical protein
MNRIKPIDLHQKDFPSSYGIDQGVFYQVEEEFFLDVIEDYKSLNSKGITYTEPQWSRIRVVSGDLIIVNGTDAYLLPKGEEYFLPCRPEHTGKNDRASFKRFPSDSLEKIGSGVTRGHSMGMMDRKKFILTRIL